MTVVVTCVTGIDGLKCRRKKHFLDTKAFVIMGEQGKNSKLLSKEKKCECHICHKSFKWNSYLIVHMRTHTGGRPYTCNTCQKSFIHSWHLKEHLKTHTEDNHLSVNNVTNHFILVLIWNSTHGPIWGHANVTCVARHFLRGLFCLNIY